ncbi:VanZ family protein [Gryllotalpicola reticulitermitis]|uniref:VanZ family protein n=1 Tax=Gryllotalpicola reticulitermitis TaxID=1184153 RepID=A0ABV8Q486_9MICO
MNERKAGSAPDRELVRAGARALLVTAFVVYLALLAWIVLWKLQAPYLGSGALREIKIVPYLPAGGDGGSGPLEVVVNVILFIPVGAFLGLLAPSWRWWMHALVLAGASLVLESTQYVMAIGSSDITDVIDNTLGGVVGLGILALLRRGSTARAETGMRRALVIVTTIFALAVVAFLLSPLRFHDPHV